MRDYLVEDWNKSTTKPEIITNSSHGLNVESKDNWMKETEETTTSQSIFHNLSITDDQN